MRALLKACGIGALAYAGLLVGLMVALTALSAETPLRSGLKVIMDVALRPLELLLPSDLGHHEDVFFALFAIAVSSACCGALAGGFVWLLFHGLGLARRHAPSGNSDLQDRHR